MDDSHLEAYQSQHNDEVEASREREQVREEEQYDKDLWDETHGI